MTVALQKLGYRAKHYPHLFKVVELAEQFDALTDSPVISYMELLDRFYPTAKFILTVRDTNEWLASCQQHLAITPVEQIKKWKLLNRRAIYGITHFDEQIFRKVYQAHEDRVRAYFARWPGKLLVMNICAGEGYEMLCPFLGLPIRQEEFPCENRRN